MNRRQVDPADRRALDLLRQGKAVASRQVRTEQGWEHEHASPAQTRQAMAQAVCDDVARHGHDRVAALVVSHGDAEDLADRIRTELAGAGQLSGPSLTGPGWTTERTYQAGDRVLLHARSGPSGSLLVNGTIATVTRVDTDGMTIRPDRGAEALLPFAFIGGARKDGSPNLSHAWARTVDGAQGGTWEACHLLGSSALDAYRGYTGQSRSRRPTHTWNTTRIGVVDHGGILADQRDGAEQTADALARQPDPTLAARNDPWVLDRRLRELIAEHERVLAARPVDRHGALAAAVDEERVAGRRVVDLDAAAGRSAAELDGLGPLAGLSRQRREQRRVLHDQLERDQQQAAAARDRHTEIADQLDGLRQAQESFRRFETVEGWRRADVVRLHHQLDHHWADVVGACVQADDPLAFGIDKLRHARTTVNSNRRASDAGVPDDRDTEWQQARQQLPGILRDRHQVETAQAESQARLDDASRRRWGRHDHQAIDTAQAQVTVTERRLQEAGAERALRERLAVLAEHQDRRHAVIANTAPERKRLDAELTRIDAALELTRPDRVAALAEDSPPHLTKRIGPAPKAPAGRSVWCHHALEIEAVLDRNDGTSPGGWTGWSPQADRARHEIAVAAQVLQASCDGPEPAEWAELARQASIVLDQARRAQHNRATEQRTARPSPEPFPTPWIDPAAEQPRPGISL